LLARYFEAYKKQLNLPDFSPDSQDKIAIQQIKEQKALDDVDAGRFDLAVKNAAIFGLHCQAPVTGSMKTKWLI